MSAHSNDLSQQRLDFLAAEQALQQHNETAFTALMTGLTDYPLYPYLQYQWLVKHLENSDSIAVFLTQFPNSYYAGLLRTKWLHYLAEQQRWQDFLSHYLPDNDNSALLQCQFHWANYQTGQTAPALESAKALWLTAEPLPKSCDELLNVLVTSPVMTNDLIWQRFELALKKDHVNLAKQLQHLLAKEQQAIADVWLQVHKKPSLITQPQFWQPTMARLFAHGVMRLAKSNVDEAITIWDNQKQAVNVDNETAQAVERQLGLKLAHERDSRAFDRLNRVLNTDEEVREWKIRAALLAQNWQQVNLALAGLTLEERQQPKWQYWQARALTETGDTLGAQAVWAKLAQDRSFYGFVAADLLNQPYANGDKPVQVSDAELSALAKEPNFKIVQEFRFHNRELDAKRHWWFAVKKLPKEKVMLAAKLAQYWQWHSVAIVTMVQADYWDDLALRFPMTYAEQVQMNANLQQLEPALIFGLMRQESMLDKNAESPVGAKGLMQLMPDTAKQVARKLNEPWQSANRLFEPEFNIKYGTFYYKELLNRFNGNIALATAAYNAGPHRVDKWLSNEKMPIDVWIETIPFKETRKYVTSVLSYTMIYSQLLQQNTLKIKNLLPDIPSI